MIRAYSKTNEIINRGVVTNSSITASSLDMNSLRITSVATPQNSTDAANKLYVDNLQVVYYTITLNGIAATVVNSITSGSYNIVVTSQVSNGPCATFQVSKSSSSINGTGMSRLTSSAGITTNERILVTWPSYSGIRVAKTGAGYNGNYTIKVS